MPGIFPNIASGGVVIRDGAGVCLDPPGVLNAYCPPAAFETSCQITALPEDCTARILPAQINALASEMLCLAATLTPEGSWDCGSTCNLAAAFEAWFDANAPVADGVTIGGEGTEALPYTLLPVGAVSSICANPAAVDALVACLISGDTPNLLSQGVDNKLVVELDTDGTIITGEGTPGSPITINLAAMISGITTSGALKGQLATGLLSATANNGISISANGLYFNSTLYVPATRNVLTQHSLTGGGSLAADRTLNLVNDVAAPGNNMVYGTSPAGVRGWFPTAASAIKAWITFNGDVGGTIYDSFNVSSFVRNVVGQYTINFTVPMANANYGIAGSASGTRFVTRLGVPVVANSVVRIAQDNGTDADSSFISVLFFGD